MKDFLRKNLSSYSTVFLVIVIGTIIISIQFSTLQTNLNISKKFKPQNEAIDKKIISILELHLELSDSIIQSGEIKVDDFIEGLNKIETRLVELMKLGESGGLNLETKEDKPLQGMINVVSDLKRKFESYKSLPLEEVKGKLFDEYHSLLHDIHNNLLKLEHNINYLIDKDFNKFLYIKVIMIVVNIVFFSVLGIVAFNKRRSEIKNYDDLLKLNTRLEKEINDRKSAENVKKRFFEISGDILAISTIDGKFNQINSAWTNILGWSAEETKDLSVLELIHPDDKEKTISAMQNLIYGKPIKMFSNRYKTKDGLYRWLSWNTTPLLDEGLIFATARDITQQKKIEFELQESERKFKSFFENSTDPMILLEDLYFIEVNNSAARLLKYENNKELLGKTPLDLSPKFQSDGRLSLEKAKEMIDITMSKGGHRFEWIHLNKDNEEINLEIVGTRIEIKGKKHFLGVWRDISDRKRAEKLLKESEQKFRHMIETLPIGLHLYKLEDNDKLIFQYGNPRANEILNFDTSRVIGKTIEEIFPPLKETEIPEVYKEVAKFGNTWFTENIDYNNEEISGAYEVFAFQTSPMNMVASFQDITERKKAQIEKEKLINSLESKNAELERFTYTVSHDLRSPLVTIKGFLGLLEEDIKLNDMEQLRADMEHISFAADKMQQLLDELLELSRIGRIASPSSFFKLNEIIYEVKKVLRGRIEKTNANLKVNENLPSIFGDKARIFEVFENLIDNALKYSRTDETPLIEIGIVEDNENECQIFIKDNGIGISPKYYEKIFGLFEKLNQSSEGTGVGLAIVKRIIEIHNGKIWVESEGNGKGSTFFIIFPKQNIGV